MRRIDSVEMVRKLVRLIDGGVGVLWLVFHRKIAAMMQL